MDFEALDKWNREMSAEAHDTPETLEYLKGVCAWRDLFKPRRIKYLAIAESHQAERPGDEVVRVRFPPDVLALVIESVEGEVPDRFVRLLHCLAYGEPGLCDPELGRRVNPGTPQFWDMLGMIARGEDSKTCLQPGMTTSSLYERIQWNLVTLNTLKAKGFHLLDASVLGVARGIQRRFAGEQYKDLIRRSFAEFVWPELGSEPIERVWILSRAVGQALQGAELSVSLAQTAGVYTDARGRLQIEASHVFSLPRNYQYPMGLITEAHSALGG